MEPNTVNEKCPWTVMKIMDVSMPDLLGDYDAAEDVMEWAWVKNFASYNFVDNDSDFSGYEFIVNVAILTQEIVESPDFPEKLRPVFRLALQNDIAYVLFHND